MIFLLTTLAQRPYDLCRAQQLIQPERGIAWLSSFFPAIRLNSIRPRPVNSSVMLLSLAAAVILIHEYIE